MLITQSPGFFPKNEYEYLVYSFPEKDFPCQDCSVFGINRLEYGHGLLCQLENMRADGMCRLGGSCLPSCFLMPESVSGNQEASESENVISVG